MIEKRILGSLFVLGNGLGVIPIVNQNGAYKPQQYDRWLESIQNAPSAHTTSALLFLVGALAGLFLGIWIYRDGKNRWARYSGVLLSLGAAYNAFWIPAPLVIAELSVSSGQFGLAMALFADSLFNGFLGLSMICLGFSNWNNNSRMMNRFGILIGSITCLVAGQFWFEEAANLLGIIGPCWLIWWLVWSFQK